jgi:RNA polymerase sporulation-specific sigma factor
MLVDSEKLLKENLKLAYFTAHKWDIKLNGKLTLEDLISDCTLALLKAAKGFDVSRNIHFATYACQCMVNQILMDIRTHKNAVLTIPVSCLKFDVGTDCEYDLWEKLQSNAARNNVEEWVNYISTKESIELVLKNLSPKHKFIMKLYFNGTPQIEIAEITKFSQSYISRIEMNILKKIKRRIKLYE